MGILNNEFTDDLSFYIHNPSVMDDTMAPKGKSALYVLAPVPNLRGNPDSGLPTIYQSAIILESFIKPEK